jgi:outer membrane protein OmpA-like peptidoglycan-associated protein
VKAENDARIAAGVVDADRLRVENEARATAAKNEADRLKLEGDSRIAAAGAEADRLKRENDAQRAAAQAALDSAASQKAQLEKEKVELRVLLLQQFNAILQTRDTARGLIVNMSDVLFDTAKFTLRPLAREKLAKVAGIVSGHPGLRLDVEGHTDSVGSDSYNQTLSEQRGESVRGYLTQQGMPAGSVTSKGFGKTQPAASNDTAKGRQENRRVEIVISGEVIGTEIGKIIAAK